MQERYKIGRAKATPQASKVVAKATEPPISRTDPVSVGSPLSDETRKACQERLEKFEKVARQGQYSNDQNLPPKVNKKDS